SFVCDNLTFRYTHGRRRTVYAPSLAVLSRAFPDLLGDDPEYWGKRGDPGSMERHSSVGRVSLESRVVSQFDQTETPPKAACSSSAKRRQDASGQEEHRESGHREGKPDGTVAGSPP